MKKIMILLCLILVLVGCAKEEKKDVTNDTAKDTQTSTTGTRTNQTDENDSQKEVIEMPTLKTVTKELGISVKDINVLEQKDNHLLFSFFDNSSTKIVEEHARKLEKDGYKLTLYDGTISSTFVLEKGNQKISMTTISALDDWKEVHKDEMNVNAIKDTDNCIYEIINKTV